MPLIARQQCQLLATEVILKGQHFANIFTISIYLVIQFIFKLYSLNYIILRTALSYFSSRILKFTIILYPLILTSTNPISRLIILSLYSTGSPKIITKV
jgi:hypothetical protein